MIYILAASLLVASIMMFALAPAAKKGLKRNAFAGVRTSATMQSEEAFTVANAAVWKGYVVNGALLLTQAVGVVVAHIMRWGYPAIGAIVIVLTLVVIGVTIWQVIIANKEARAVVACGGSVKVGAS